MEELDVAKGIIDQLAAQKNSSEMERWKSDCSEWR